jgi:hypothetical protein
MQTTVHECKYNMLSNMKYDHITSYQTAVVKQAQRHLDQKDFVDLWDF